MTKVVFEFYHYDDKTEALLSSISSKMLNSVPEISNFLESNYGTAFHVNFKPIITVGDSPTLWESTTLDKLSSNNGFGGLTKTDRTAIYLAPEGPGLIYWSGGSKEDPNYKNVVQRFIHEMVHAGVPNIAGDGIPNLHFAEYYEVERYWYDILGEEFPKGEQNKLQEAIQKTYYQLDATRCFSRDTVISLSSGVLISISEVNVGDHVASFDPVVAVKRESIHSGVVRHIFHNITDVWIKLSNGLTVTPGYHFLDAFGKFRPIADIIASDGQVVLEDGSIAKVTGEYIHYSEATAHLYEQAEGYATPVVGGLALAPVYKKGWKTYNFEVEDYHTYIAGGVRVHNDSIVYSIKPGDTLWSIGNRYDVSVSVLALLNGIRSPDEIYAGNPLQVPDASSLEATQRCQELRTAATDRHPVLAQFRSCGNGHHPRRFSRPAICRLPGTATGDASRRTPAGRRTAGIVAHPEESRERA